MAEAYYPKSEVSMSREMLSTVASEYEFDLARDSVKESMKRLYPHHRYRFESIHSIGKLTVVTFHFGVSGWALYKHRLQARWKQFLSGRRSAKHEQYSLLRSFED